MTAGSPLRSPRIQATRGASVNPIRLPPPSVLALGVLLAAILLSARAFAQEDSGTEIRFRLRTTVELVLVPVTAKDAEGNLVTDLKREDFRLFEEGEEQPIRYFSIDPFPLSAVILVDGALSRSAHEAIQETLPVVASAFAPEDEFALYAFEIYPHLLLDFTRDADQLRRAIRVFSGDVPTTPGRITGGPMTAGPRINTVPIDPGVRTSLPQARKSVKSIHDALFAAGMALRDRERGRRRVIFLISDGVNSRLNVHSFDETRGLLLAEDVSVYAIGVGNARFALGTTVLSDYARATGGDLYTPMKKDSLAHAYARVAEQARYQYTLVYAARPFPGGREYRRIEVRVERPGVTLRAREGYFAGLPTH